VNKLLERLDETIHAIASEHMLGEPDTIIVMPIFGIRNVTYGSSIISAGVDLTRKELLGILRNAIERVEQAI
jgi:hypothetical protein